MLEAARGYEENSFCLWKTVKESVMARYVAQARNK